MGLWNWRRVKPRRVDRLLAEDRPSWREALRSPRALAQLVVAAGFFILTLFVVQWPYPPLPVHKGEKATHPILAHVDFDYVDHAVTADVRELASLVEVPALYRPESRPIATLEENLLALVNEAAKATSVEKMPEAMQSEWHPNAAMFEALKRALGDEAVHLAAVQGAVRKAMAALAKWPDVAIVREEDYQRAVVRLQRIKDLRNKLPVGISGDVAALPPEPVAEIRLLVEGEPMLPLQLVMTPTQTDRIQARIARTLDPTLQPIFGAEGTGLLSIAMAPRIGPTLVYDQAETENRRAEVKKRIGDVRIPRKANTTLVEAGKEITDEDLRLLEQEQAARLSHRGALQKTLVWAGAAVVIGILIGLQSAYIRCCQTNVWRSMPRSLILAALCLLVIGVSKAVAQNQGLVPLYALLLVTAGMIITIAYTQVFALAVTWLLVPLVALATRSDLDWAITALAGTAAAILSLGEINNRSKLMKVGALAGLVFSATFGALALRQLDYSDALWGNIPQLVLWPAFLYLCAGLAAGAILLALLPFIERTFGIATNISLLELCDVNQPALRRLALEAPGTYSHSLLIGSLAEAAAESIGANGLLARVGAYFHDIGKANKPHYFVENWQDIQGTHESLTPAMSRLIILSHVKDGLAMADRLGLPPSLKQFIARHHGTTLMEYFYREAEERAAAGQEAPPVESDYRYPGPKPDSPETAIVMLADAVEGATRSLKEQTPARVTATVHNMVMKRLLDGQLDSSGLTLSDLHKIDAALTKALFSVYHGRVPYPPDRASEAAAEENKSENGERGGNKNGGNVAQTGGSKGAWLG